ncbi:MAG: hypothetical protein DMF49_02520 [Acidobacteria bacterium]|nr:MAG: hypothetical protein DMF49_02520 [Acidobacteriota bacterium]
MALQGTLKDFGLTDIFQLIGIQRKTGVLTLRRQEEAVSVSFLNGQVVYAETVHRGLEERIGSLLVKTGKLTPARLQEALKIQASTLQRLGTILLDQKMITQADLKEVLQVQMTQIIYNLFRWKDGEYHFSQEESVDHDPQVFTALSADTVLMEGARTMDEWPIIERRIPSFDIVFARARDTVPHIPRGGSSVYDTDVEFGFGGQDGSLPRGVSLAPEEEAVFRLVDGRSTVQDVIDRSKLGDFETCRILYDLLNRNLLEEKTEDAGTGGAAHARRSSSWNAVARAGLPLLAVLSVLMVPWNPLSPLGRGGVLTPDEVSRPVSRSRLSRIDLGLRVFYLEKGALPKSLEALETQGVLAPEDLHDPWGRPYSYRIEPTRYDISGSGPSGENDTALAVSYFFSASQRLVIEGGIDALEGSQRR